MFKKINKKIIFRASILFSSFLTLIAGSKADTALLSGLIDSIPPVSSLAKVEKAYAFGAGDCCGSCGCDAYDPAFATYELVWPTETSSGVALWFSTPTQTVTVLRPSSNLSCFIAGTKVTMADGSIKNIEEVTVGESLLASEGKNVVEEVFILPHVGDIYALNESENYFFTAGHPFMTTDGWKSMDPEVSKMENPGLEVGQMQVGDILLKIDGQTEVISLIKEQEAETTVYNFKVSGDNSYYADGYLVHNAALKRFR